jgi:hypothetical protein
MTTYSQHVETQLCKVLLVEYNSKSLHTIFKTKWISYEKLMFGIQKPLLSNYWVHNSKKKLK